MKKLISAIAAVIIGSASLTSYPLADEAPSVAAAEKDSIVFLGDSIASGYGLADGEASYARICADYLGWDMTNYAVPGYDTDDLRAQIAALTVADKKTIADAEVVVISVGGNDIVHYLAKSFLEFAAENNYLNAGYTAADVAAISKPTMTQMRDMVNINGAGGLKEYVKNGGNAAQMKLAALFGSMTSNLTTADDKNEGYIHNVIVPAISDIAGSIKAISPDTRIIVQTVYQPFELQYDFLSANYPEGVTALGLLRFDLESIMKSFRTELSAVEGIEVADVFADISSIADSKKANKTPGYAWYFTNMQKANISEMDFHPNQAGHLAIAAKVLETIGSLHKDSGLLTSTFASLSDRMNYPDIAFETYKKVCGDENAVKLPLGDVNGDGLIDSADSSLILYANARMTENEDVLIPVQWTAADVNGDSMADSVDASLILVYNAYVVEKGPTPFGDFLKTVK